MKKLNGHFLIVIVFSMSIFFTNCKKDKSNSTNTIQNVTGYAQKGPFINGSAVTVYDLQADLSPSGKSYNAQITDNKGTFQLNDIPLSSSYASLRVDGFYFNEVLGQQSAAQITLYSLCDVSGTGELNINILTHLEKSRVEYLIKNGQSFEDSKIQAQREVLAIFNIEKEDIKISEQLKISESGDDNGILLAVSAIMQGYRTESEMTELLSNISNDIMTDGVLNSTVLGSHLISHAVVLDTVSIKNNLAKRYRDIGATVDVPDFGKYISNFIENTNFDEIYSLFTYPETGVGGENILSLSKTNFLSGPENTVSLSAHSVKGTSLKIKITSLNEINMGSENDGLWVYYVGSEINWQVSTLPYGGDSQTFTMIESGKSSDIKMAFSKGSFLIEYFEMNSAVPTRSKTIFCD